MRDPTQLSTIHPNTKVRPEFAHGQRIRVVSGWASELRIGVGKHVFISYAHAEGSWAEEVEAGLRAAGLPVWRDVDGIPAQRDLTSAIENAIADSSHVVVCLTETANKAESWTRREVQFALVLADPDFARADEVPPDIIPIVFPGGRPFVSIATRPFLKLDRHGMPALMKELVRRIQMHVAYVQPGKSQRTTYLRELYARITNRLPKTLDEIIAVNVEWTPDAVARPRSVELPPSATVAEAFEKIPRLLALGLPGSGKTTAVYLVARRLVLAALDDPKSPLPVVATLSNWDRVTEFEAWLDAHVPVGLETEQRVYLLDGLDELGNVDDERLKNPKLVVLDALATSLRQHRVLLTSRPEGYLMGRKVELDGAVTLARIAEREMLAYLRRWGAETTAARLVGTREVRDLMSTPLGARLLVDAGELRDASEHGLIDAWVSAQLLRETARTNIPVDERMVRAALATFALAGVIEAPATRYCWPSQQGVALDEPSLEIAQRAGILLRALDGGRTFFHAAVFDHFAISAVRDFARRIPRGAAVALAMSIDTILGGRGADVFAELVAEQFDSEERKSTYLNPAAYTDARYVPVFLALYSNNSGATDHWLSKIAAFGDAALPTLKRALHGVERLARAAASALATFGAPGVELLYGALSDEQPHVRIAALERLPPHSASPSDLAVLHRLVTDSQTQIRAAATRALGVASREDETPRLLVLANDPVPEVRMQSLAALQASRAPAAHQALRVALADPNENVRAYAIAGLLQQGAISDVESILLNETGSAVQVAAMHFSEHAATLPTRLLVELLESAATQIVREYAAFGLRRRPEAIPALLGKLATDDSDLVHYAVLEALASNDDPRVVSALVDALRRDDRAGKYAVDLLVRRAPTLALAAFEQAECNGWFVDSTGTLTTTGLWVRLWAASADVPGAQALAERLDG